MYASEIEAVRKIVFDYDLRLIVQRFSEERGIPIELANKYAIELKRFLFLEFLTRRQYGMLGMTDDFWHLFIIYTKIYHDFCQKAFGAYIHHNPSVSKEVDPKISDSLSYLRFLIDYFRYFEECPPYDVWPFSRELFGDVAYIELVKLETSRMISCQP